MASATAAAVGSGRITIEQRLFVKNFGGWLRRWPDCFPSKTASGQREARRAFAWVTEAWELADEHERWEIATSFFLEHVFVDTFDRGYKISVEDIKNPECRMQAQAQRGVLMTYAKEWHQAHVGPSRVPAVSGAVARDTIGPPGETSIEGSADSSSWPPINLNHLEPRDKVTPTIGGVGLVYPGKCHVFSGPPESAKTIAAYATMLEEIRLGGLVVLIDFEMGRDDANDRLREMGASDAEIDRLVFYEPDVPATPAIIEEIAAASPTLVVIDAGAGAYELQGLDDMSRRDVERFARLYTFAFRRRGIATIVIEHVVKNTENRGRFPIGSERKLGVVDVHLGFERVQTLTRGGTGRFKIRTLKDKLGHLKPDHIADLVIVSDPVTHALGWTFNFIAPSASSIEGSEWKPTGYMERVSRHLEKFPDGLTRTALYRDVEGKRERVIQATNQLQTDGHLYDNGRLLRLLQPYRESEDLGAAGSHSVPAQNEDAGSHSSPGSEAVPDQFLNVVSPSVPSVPPPEGGTEEPGEITVPKQDGLTRRREVERLYLRGERGEL